MNSKTNSSKQKTFKWLKDRLKINVDSLTEMVPRKEVLLLLDLQQEIFKSLMPKETSNGKK